MSKIKDLVFEYIKNKLTNTIDPDEVKEIAQEMILRYEILLVAGFGSDNFGHRFLGIDD